MATWHTTGGVVVSTLNDEDARGFSEAGGIPGEGEALT
ncbi:MAG: hypothetical protein AVDCRST_MAG55-3091 [uncultured Rubrobacteraceae bacterium]|uniref:Uncharacterized protein n=1 Tax=uncultured Rubrobacteraceae bacterium TaxID=349277 RepID=A0A6J4QB28_9ACTN|nr:MAG: hypothetical protein AVDCRST_MAG55-3091 [uncultured Rubrobacteraceae bacterium]